MTVPLHTHDLIIGFSWTWHTGESDPLFRGFYPPGYVVPPHILLDDQKLYVVVAPSIRDGRWHGGTLYDGRATGEHIVELTMADVIAGTEKVYTTVGGISNRANHQHEVTLTSVDFTAILAIQLANLAAGTAIAARYRPGDAATVALTKTMSAASAP